MGKRHGLGFTPSISIFVFMLSFFLVVVKGSSAFRSNKTLWVALPCTCVCRQPSTIDCRHRTWMWEGEGGGGREVTRSFHEKHRKIGRSTQVSIRITTSAHDHPSRFTKQKNKTKTLCDFVSEGFRRNVVLLELQRSIVLPACLSMPVDTIKYVLHRRLHAISHDHTRACTRSRALTPTGVRPNVPNTVLW